MNVFDVALQPDMWPDDVLQRWDGDSVEQLRNRVAVLLNRPHLGRDCWSATVPAACRGAVYYCANEQRCGSDMLHGLEMMALDAHGVALLLLLTVDGDSENEVAHVATAGLAHAAALIEHYRKAARRGVGAQLH